MKVALVYVMPTVMLPTYLPLAQRFVRSYLEHPPGEIPHEIHVFLNGPEAPQLRKLFDSLPVTFHSHNNYGKDLGAFLMASATIACDLLVCFGSHIHFRRQGWLDRIVQSYLQAGPGLYGCWGFHQPAPHLRTTAFWLPPFLLASYPHPVDNDHRYQFEHGPKTSILRWALDSGLPAGMVTWTATRMYPNFDHVPNQDCLMLDQHSDRIHYT